MRLILSVIGVVILNTAFYSQLILSDSLVGFDYNSIITSAVDQKISPVDYKGYIKLKEREFIKRKYNLADANTLQVPLFKLNNNNSVANAPCIDEDFESVSLGPMPASSSGWTITHAVNQFANTIICNTTNIVYTTPTGSTYVSVIGAPYSDPIIGGLPSSPFGGSRIAAISSNTAISNRVVKMAQTFSVTNSNPIFNYAFLPITNEPVGHTCCDAASLIFRFYDCNGNLISSKSVSVTTEPQSTLCPGLSSINWQSGSSSTNIFFSGWKVISENLCSYNGSCVTFEVLTSFCPAGGHFAYCYFDAKCTSGGLSINGNYVGSSSYTSCLNPATLQAIPCALNYTWTGPPGSGVSNFTNSAFTTTTAGTYTLSTASGSVSLTQTVNLLINSNNLPVISGTNSLCVGKSATLQVNSSPGTLSYLWSSGAGASSIVVTPTSTTNYSVAITNSIGCLSQAQITVTVFPNPTVSILPSSTVVCQGQSINLFGISSTANSYTWSNSVFTSSIIVTPISNITYSLIVANVNGCKTSAISPTILVKPIPQIQIVSSSNTICLGQPVSLTVTGVGSSSVNWSTGSSLTFINVNPLVNTLYSVAVTNSNNCTASAVKSVSVISGPAIQLLSTNSVVCVGQSVNLNVAGSGIVNYLWGNGSTASSITITPTTSTVYSVMCSNSAGCFSSDSVNVLVLPLPSVLLNTAANNICLGESVQLFGTSINAISYLWNTGSTSATISVSPTITSVYSLTVNDANGCFNTASLSINVDFCLETLELQRDEKNEISIFPIPATNQIVIKSKKPLTAEIFDVQGKYIRRVTLDANNDFNITVYELAKGQYIIQSGNFTKKFIIY